MLDRLGADLFEGGYAPHDVLFSELTQVLTTDGDTATLQIPIPFTEKAEIDLKKVGDELIVSVGGEKRNIILPSALADRSPSGARFEAGTLKVTFDDVRSPGPQPERV
jgi:arsenite-transporting ATPase